MLVGRIFHPGRRHECNTVCATGNSLPCSFSKGINKGVWNFWYSESSLHQVGSRPAFFIPWWKTHHWTLYQVRDAITEVIEASALPSYSYRFAIMATVDRRTPDHQTVIAKQRPVRQITISHLASRHLTVC